jgi:membrane protease subunit HflC
MRNIIIIIAGVILVSILSSLYTVDQREQAIVLQLGEAVRLVKEPGLHVKIPFVQNVVKFDNRILDLNARPNEVIASDQKRLIVDAFVKYKIIDPLKFYQTVREERVLRQRLNTNLDSSLRQVLGSVPLSALLTGERSDIMNNIQRNVAERSKEFGIDVVDVRIMRADLPQENSKAIYKRMQTEREREAKEFRAQGAEEAQRIRARAEKERTIILAEAEKKAQILRGEGDAEANKVFSDAFSLDEDFFAFYRTMQAYRNTLKKEDTTMVLSPENEFMKYFSDIKGKKK